MSQPDVQAWWDMIMGDASVDLGALTSMSPASGMVVGTNPPYAIADFLAIYPKFGTITTAGDGTTTYTGVVPQVVLQMYVSLASASLMQARWLDMWPMVMTLFIAHYCTLYLRSEGNPGTTAGQIAASGLEKGIKVAQSAGDVSESRQLVQGIEDFGSFNQTTYGVQFATLAKTIGSMPVLVR